MSRASGETPLPLPTGNRTSEWSYPECQTAGLPTQVAASKDLFRSLSSLDSEWVLILSRLTQIKSFSVIIKSLLWNRVDYVSASVLSPLFEWHRQFCLTNRILLHGTKRRKLLCGCAGTHETTSLHVCPDKKQRR